MLITVIGGAITGGALQVKFLAEFAAAFFAALFDRDKIGFEGKWLVIGISSGIAFVFLVYWFSWLKR